MSARRYCESNAITSDPLPMRRSRGMIQILECPVPSAPCPVQTASSGHWARGTGHLGTSFLVYLQDEGGETVGTRLRREPQNAAIDPPCDLGINEVGDIATFVAGRDVVILLGLERAGRIHDIS